MTPLSASPTARLLNGLPIQFPGWAQPHDPRDPALVPRLAGVPERALRRTQGVPRIPTSHDMGPHATASASISISIAGSISARTSTMLVHGVAGPKYSACARPYSAHRLMSVTNLTQRAADNGTRHYHAVHAHARAHNAAAVRAQVPQCPVDDLEAPRRLHYRITGRTS